MSLAPQTNTANQAQQQAQKAATPPEDQPLDPPFPYNVIEFDPRRFGMLTSVSSRD